MLLLLLSLVSLDCIIARSENEVPNLRSAPHKDIGNNIIDGTGEEKAFSIDGQSSRVGDRKAGTSKVSVSTVALFTLAMAAATGLGAVPFFFVELDPQWAGLCNGMAAGVMLAASFDLVQEGQLHGAGAWVVIGILCGGIFIWLCKQVNIFFSFVGNLH